MCLDISRLGLIALTTIISLLQGVGTHIREARDIGQGTTLAGLINMEEVEPSTRVVRKVCIITTLVVTRLTSPRGNSKNR
jgi:hypothetical protein